MKKYKGYHPKNPHLSPRFADIATFSRLPHTQDLSGVDAAIVGIPFDGGTTYRPGARLGPRAIRNASCLNRNFHPGHAVNIYEHLSVIDFGDIPCNPLSLKKTFSAIENTYATLLKAGVLPVGLGGDHLVLYPILKAMKKRHDRFGLIQFDAHTDTADQAWGEKFHHGTWVRRLVEEGTLKGCDIYQIGIRGPLTSKEQADWDSEQGITRLTVETPDKTLNKTLNKMLNKMDQSIPYYLTFDVDAVDPAYAPGTGTPVVGGLTSREALFLVRSFRGLKFIGFDVVEVSPPYDHAEITSLLACSLVFEFLALRSVSDESD